MSRVNACVIAGGQCKFGVREASYIDMVQEAAKACLDDLPYLKPKNIDGLLFASTYVGRNSCQVNPAPVVAERVGLKPTSICTRVDVLCAGGSSGILLAQGLVQSGMAEVVMVLGSEKLYTPERWQIQYGEIAASDHDWDAPQGIGPPPLWFAMQAKDHMKHYGTTREQQSIRANSFRLGTRSRSPGNGCSLCCESQAGVCPICTAFVASEHPTQSS